MQNRQVVSCVLRIYVCMYIPHIDITKTILYTATYTAGLLHSHCILHNKLFLLFRNMFYSANVKYKFQISQSSIMCHKLHVCNCNTKLSYVICFI